MWNDRRQRAWAARKSILRKLVVVFEQERRALGLPHKHLAGEIGSTELTVAAVLSGEVDIDSFDDCFEYADALGLRLEVSAVPLVIRRPDDAPTG